MSTSTSRASSMSTSGSRASPPPAGGLRKSLERLGRRFLTALLALLLGRRRRPVVLPAQPRILVVRLDERVGNLIMLTPLLASLRARFLGAELELLANAKNRALLSCLAEPTAVLLFDKRALLSSIGPLWTPFRLRRRRYDVAVDAANPTDPSLTQALLTRLSGARHTVGFEHGSFGPLFSAPVASPQGVEHEIDMRLALLDAFSGTARVRRVRLNRLSEPASGSATLAVLSQLTRGEYVVINVGARLRQKRLGPDTYAGLGRIAVDCGRRPLFTYGPAEAELAAAAASAISDAVLAPPTSILELGALMQHAAAVITCDTGPMHLAVAVGVPTCGIFVATDPRRFGYAEAPHQVVDARESGCEDTPEGWLAVVRDWVATLSSETLRSAGAAAR